MYIRDGLETWKLEIPPSEFCLISCDSDKIGIQKLPSYSMLQKARFTAFTFFELLRENQEWSIFEKLDFRLIFKSRSKKENNN